MSFKNLILDSFLKEEATNDVRQVLIKHIEDCLNGKLKGYRQFNFNVYDITVNEPEKRVLIESDLDPSPDGQTTLSFEEFLNAIRL